MRFRVALLVVALAVFGIAGEAIARSDAATKIKSVRLEVNPDGTGTYTGKVTSRDKDCLKHRKVKVIHLSDPPFTIGETVTDDSGHWTIDGPIPPPGTPQVIKVDVSANKDCLGRSKTYQIDNVD